MTSFRRLLLAALALLSIAAPGAFAQAPVAHGEPARAQKAAPEPTLRLPSQAAERRVKLAPVADTEVEKVRAQNARARQGLGPRANLKRIAVGIERALPREDAAGIHPGEWQPVAGGIAARLSITSPDAPAMRAAFDLADVALDVEMVFFGSAAPERLFGPYRVADVVDRSVPWWSPVTQGETLTVEVFVPRRDDAARSPALLQAAHLFADPSRRDADKRLQDIGKSGSCNVDIPCSGLRASTAFQNLVSSVAQMVFNDGSFLYLCTGTLLNDQDASTQVPWFYSANHCFDDDSAPRSPSQMQSIASTLVTYWFFEASACGSSTPNPGWQQVGGGATYVYSNAQSDALFIRLNNPPPAGAFYTGWNANPIGGGTAVVDVHHPQGDLKKVSQGSVLGFAGWDSSTGATQYIEARWSSGTTEGGSSGSGLFTPSGSEYVLRGGLRGGTALCDNPGGTDYFSRFDQVFPAISQYLVSSSPSNSPLANVTGLWFLPRESGWGVSLIHHSGSNIVFGTWYTYAADGKRTWYVMPSGTWTSSNTVSGTLYLPAGPAFNGPFDPSLVTVTPVGTGTLTLDSPTTGTWSFTVNGASGSRQIQKFDF